MKEVKTKKCLFCGKPKTYWKSDITVQIHNLAETITVCPEDRKTHTIYDIYSQIAKDDLENAKRVIDEEIKRCASHLTQDSRSNEQ